MSEVEPHVVRLREDAAGWRQQSTERRLRPDDPFLTGLTEQEANALVRSQWALVASTVEEAEAFYGPSTPAAPFDPAEYSVDDLETELADGEYTAAELDALAAAESEGKDRTTAHDAIDAARNGGDD